jgi:hypothetical protein
VIAVPAIGCNPTATWSLADDQRDLDHSSLYSEVTDARVYLYAHPPQDPFREYSIVHYAKALLAYLVQLPLLGQRPLHFAAHSTGGIVVKQALSLALNHEHEKHVAIIRKCFSVAFWGVPRKTNSQSAAVKIFVLMAQRRLWEYNSFRSYA